MILEADFEDFVRLLNKHKVAYMIVGGYALAFHGKPRHTGDLDIWIEISAKNARAMLTVIKDFGFGQLGFTKDDFLRPGYISQLGYPPLRIDILNEIDGVSFAEAAPHTIYYQVDDSLKIPVIGLKELLRNKESSGRKQDLADILTIKKLQKSKLK